MLRPPTGAVSYTLTYSRLVAISPYRPSKRRSSCHVGAVVFFTVALCCSCAPARTFTYGATSPFLFFVSSPTPWLTSMCSVPTCFVSGGGCTDARSHTADSSTCPASCPASDVTATAQIAPGIDCSSTPRSTRPSPSTISPRALSCTHTAIGVPVSASYRPSNDISVAHLGSRVFPLGWLDCSASPTVSRTYGSPSASSGGCSG